MNIAFHCIDSQLIRNKETFTLLLLYLGGLFVTFDNVTMLQCCTKIELSHYNIKYHVHNKGTNHRPSKTKGRLQVRFQFSVMNSLKINSFIQFKYIFLSISVMKLSYCKHIKIFECWLLQSSSWYLVLWTLQTSTQL